MNYNKIYCSLNGKKNLKKNKKLCNHSKQNLIKLQIINLFILKKKAIT